MKKILFLFLIGTLCFSPLLAMNVADAATVCKTKTTKNTCEAVTNCSWDSSNGICYSKNCSVHNGNKANCENEENCIWDVDTDKCAGAPYFSVIGSVNSVTNWIFNIIILISVIYLMLGAIGYITAQGDAERIKASWQKIMYALLGVGVALLARGLVSLVTKMMG